MCGAAPVGLRPHRPSPAPKRTPTRILPRREDRRRSRGRARWAWRYAPAGCAAPLGPNSSAHHVRRCPCRPSTPPPLSSAEEDAHPDSSPAVRIDGEVAVVHGGRGATRRGGSGPLFSPPCAALPLPAFDPTASLQRRRGRPPGFFPRRADRRRSRGRARWAWRYAPGRLWVALQPTVCGAAPAGLRPHRLGQLRPPEFLHRGRQQGSLIGARAGADLRRS